MSSHLFFFFFKQKTAYEIPKRDWSSDVCSSDLIGAAGRLITPQEAETLFRRDHQEMSADIVFFSLSNYLSKVVITNGALTNFYAQRPPRIPDKVRVSYVEFNRSNYM